MKYSQCSGPSFMIRRVEHENGAGIIKKSVVLESSRGIVEWYKNKMY